MQTNLDALKEMLSGVSADDLIKILPYETLNEISNYIDFINTKEDIKLEMEYDLNEMSKEQQDAFAEKVAHRYVYDCEYDCNLSYWENLDNIIRTEISNFQ